VPGTASWRRLRLALIAADAVALALAFALSSLVRTQQELLPLRETYTVGVYALMSAALIPLLLGLYRAHGLYRVEELPSAPREYARVAHATTYGSMLVIALSYFYLTYFLSDLSPVSRSWLLLSWLSAVVAVVTGRFLFRRRLSRLRRHGSLQLRVLMVGGSEQGVEIAEQFVRSPASGIKVVGFLDEYLPIGTPVLPGVAVVGRSKELARITEEHRVDEVVVVAAALPHEALSELVAGTLARPVGPRVRMAPSIYDLVTMGLGLIERANVPLLTVGQARIVGPDALVKRAFDLAGALLLWLLAWLPVALLVARAWMRGERTLFERRTLVGMGGRPVEVRLLARAVAGESWLRGVPTLAAVIRGQLSLVGPRPAVSLSGGQTAAVPALTAVKPGLTGPWRLTGENASLAEQTMQDLRYVRDYTIWEDLRIIWQSLRRLRLERRTRPLGRWQEQSATAWR
jgi:lipopolysaccharide/colanic/teichoic acid biosynthesis glycosyltransferase